MLFTGARPREVCQSNPQVDFGQVDGHWYVDLDEKSPAGKGVRKTIKTGEARRVPLHPELIRLGFPEYVQRLRNAGADRLFPSWRVKSGNPYTANGVLFSDLLRRAGLYTAASGEQVTGAYTLRKKPSSPSAATKGWCRRKSRGTATAPPRLSQDRSYIFGPEPFTKKLNELRKLVLRVKVPPPPRRAEAGP